MRLWLFINFHFLHIHIFYHIYCIVQIYKLNSTLYGHQTSIPCDSSNAEHIAVITHTLCGHQTSIPCDCSNADHIAVITHTLCGHQTSIPRDSHNSYPMWASNINTMCSSNAEQIIINSVLRRDISPIKSSIMRLY